MQILYALSLVIQVHGLVTSSSGGKYVCSRAREKKKAKRRSHSDLVLEVGLLGVHFGGLLRDGGGRGVLLLELRDGLSELLSNALL